MTDTKFTPGPWLVVGSIPEEGSDCFWIKAQPHPAMRGFTKDIGTVDGYQDDPERAANAHLIAAAPEMYEAAKEALAVIEKIRPQENGKGTIVRLQRALAKAEGKS